MVEALLSTWQNGMIFATTKIMQFDPSTRLSKQGSTITNARFGLRGWSKSINDEYASRTSQIKGYAS